MSNNAAERAIRRIALGGKNYSLRVPAPGDGARRSSYTAEPVREPGPRSCSRAFRRPSWTWEGPGETTNFCAPLLVVCLSKFSCRARRYCEHRESDRAFWSPPRPRRVGNMEVVIAGVPPNTDFDLFVIAVPTKPFGLAWYNGDIPLAEAVSMRSRRGGRGRRAAIRPPPDQRLQDKLTPNNTCRTRPGAGSSRSAAPRPSSIRCSCR
jgi:hypothetical protein